MIKLILALSVLFTTPAFALVDMDKKSYTNEWFDLSEFEATREYRAGTTGAFGKNWCSILDTAGTCSHTSNKQKDLTFTVTEGKVTQVVSKKNNKTYAIFYNDKGLISEIKSNGSPLAEFRYNKNNQLSFVLNDWNSKYNYEYNNVGHLEKTTWPDKTFIQIRYNSKNEVVGFLDRDGCVEEYKYTGNPKAYHKATAHKFCGNEEMTTNTYEFWTVTKKNESNLKRLRTKANGNERDIIYNDNGQPVSINQNGSTTTYEYDKQNRVTKKSASYEVVEYTYSSEGQIAEVKQTNFDHNKKATTVTTQFKYKGELVVSASNSKGKSIQLTYDKKDRIATITDQDKKKVSITYDGVFGKPEVISVSETDAVVVTYKKNGSIDKAYKSKGSTADQAFNELLDIISPATADIY